MLKAEWENLVETYVQLAEQSEWDTGSHLRSNSGYVGSHSVTDSMPSIRSQEVRTAKLASKVLSRDHIGKAPSDIEAAILIAPAATAHCFDVSRPVPLVHIV